MTNKEKKFEESLVELEQIVDKLEQGDIPLDEALTEFKNGITLSRTLKKELQQAEKTLAKIINEDGSEEILEFDE